MRSGFWTNLKRCLVGGLTGAMLCAGSARADEKSELENLKQRIEALEKQNDELKKTYPVDFTPNAAGAVAPQALGAPEAAKADQGFAVGSDRKLSGSWSDTRGSGVAFESANKDFKYHIGGRLMYDNVWWTQDPFTKPATQFGTYTDGDFFRRLRIQLDGTCWEVFEYAMEFDFEKFDQGMTSMDEMWVGMKEIPGIGSARIGHIKIPQGLETYSSSRTLTFMERSPLFDAFQNEFSSGIWLTNAFGDDQRATYALAGYRFEQHGNNGADFGDGEYAATGRLTALPIYENEGRCLVHLGVSATWRHAERPDPSLTGPAFVRFRSRPSMRDAQGDFGGAVSQVALPGASILPGNTVRLVDTGAIRCDSATLLGAEFLSIWGAFSLQAEGMAVRANDARFGATGAIQDDVNFTGYYVTASYFLTGENRAYDKRLGRIGSSYIAKPNTNFWIVRDCDGNFDMGRGAWEVAARYSWLNLDDGRVGGGKLSEWTVGLNWYLCQNAKIQFQYLIDNRWDVRLPGTTQGGNGPPPQRSGDLHGFGVRTVFEF